MMNLTVMEDNSLLDRKKVQQFVVFETVVLFSEPLSQQDENACAIWPLMTSLLLLSTLKTSLDEA